jgi:hypothetical protein
MPQKPAHKAWNILGTGSVASGMRYVCAGVAVIALLTCGAAGYAETVGDCDHAIGGALRSRGTLLVDSEPAGIEVVGTDKDEIHVTCTVKRDGDPRDIELRLSGTEGYERLKISGGGAVHNQNLEVRIEVPKKLNLRVRMGAGQVTVSEVAGDKDIDLYAGQITIRTPEKGSYKSVDASVDIGEVNAAAYGVEKGGFFRSFSRTMGNGEYRLRAHVMTGQIDLE